MTDRQETMRAVAATRPGGPEVLVVETRPRPLPGAGEVLIKVEAAGVNRPDVLQRMGFYAPPPGASDILGLEVAGSVVARGPGAARYREGARVTALVPGGGYAEYCVAHEIERPALASRADGGRGGRDPRNLLYRLDECLRPRRAQGRRDPARSRRDVGDRHDGDPARQGVRRQGDRDGGLGRKGRAMHAARRRCRRQLPHGRFCRPDLCGHGRGGADVVLDMVGGDYVARNYAAAAMDGRIVQIAFLRGPAAEVDFGRSCTSGSSTPVRPSVHARRPRRRSLPRPCGLGSGRSSRPADANP